MKRDWDLRSAIEAFEQGKGQEWIESYLEVESWQNLGLLRRVRAFSSAWRPPQLIEIAKLGRVAGPSESYRFPHDPAEWNRAVEAIVAARPTLESLPPLIAWREEDGLINLADGNHRVDALTSMGITSCWVLIHDGPLRSQEEIARRRAQLKP